MDANAANRVGDHWDSVQDHRFHFQDPEDLRLVASMVENADGRDGGGRGVG